MYAVRSASAGRNRTAILNGANNVVFIDFDTGMTRSLFEVFFEAHEIPANSEGLFTLLPSCHLLVEEENSGRFLMFSPYGTMGAEYVN